MTRVYGIAVEAAFESCMLLCRNDGSGLQPTSELFAYNIANDQWELHGPSDAAAASDNSFKARNAHIFSACGSRLIAHGGWDPFKKTYNDTIIWTP